MVIKYKKFGLCKVVGEFTLHGQRLYKLKPIQPIYVERKWTVGDNYVSAPRNKVGYLYDMNKIMHTYLYVPVDALMKTRHD